MDDLHLDDERTDEPRKVWGLAAALFGVLAVAAALREFAAALSTNPDFVRWMLTKDLIRKFVVSVDNVANGLSPKPHVDFFAPAGEFRVARTKEGTLVDTAAHSP